MNPNHRIDKMLGDLEVLRANLITLKLDLRDNPRHTRADEPFRNAGANGNFTSSDNFEGPTDR